MKIKISSIVVQTLIGCYGYEREGTQDVIVDIEAELYSYNWVTQDKLDTTVDYDLLTDFVAEIVAKTEYKLLESLAQFVTASVLERFPLIKTICVDLVKPAISGIKAREIKVSHFKQRKFAVALALGSNNEYLPQQQLITAIEILGEYITDIQIGKLYMTKPVGYEPQPNFYNTAITGTTILKPEELLGKIKSIEKLMGKQETVLNGPRIIDIDLILFANLVYTHNFLSVPHKGAHLRDFVLQPLVDIAPDWVHPKLNKTLTELLSEIPESERAILEQVSYYKD